MKSQHHPQRKSPRLQGYDYTQAGAYFVTICTHERSHLFGEIRDGEMILNPTGITVRNAIQNIHTYWNNMIDVDCFVVMPNHVHLIVFIRDPTNLSETQPKQSRVPKLGQIISNYKAGVTREIRIMMNDPGRVVWRSRYYDHIIRDENDFNRIREYIVNNPGKWEDDSLYS